MKKVINILLVEDSKSFAQGMELLLKQFSNVGNVLHSIGQKEIFDILEREEINIAILDLNLETKHFDGFSVAKKIRQSYQSVKIIVLSQHTRKQYYNILFKENLADAYLDKQLGVEEIFKAIEAVISGKQYVDRNIIRMLEIETWMHVSKREKEVIQLLRGGLTQKEVASHLGISPKTIEGHLRNMFERFLVKNTTELIAKYIKYINSTREDVEDSFSPFME